MIYALLALAYLAVGVVVAALMCDRVFGCAYGDVGYGVSAVLWPMVIVLGVPIYIGALGRCARWLARRIGT